MSAAIGERLELEIEARASDVEWSTRTLAQFIAATAMTGKKGNPLVKDAAKLEHPLLARTRKGRRPRTTPDDLPLPDDVDPALARAAARNKPGSFERLMGMG